MCATTNASLYSLCCFLLVHFAQRRDYRVLAEQLPPKQEYVLNIRQSPIQDKLYRRFLEQTRGVFLPSDLFSTYHTLSKVRGQGGGEIEF